MFAVRIDHSKAFSRRPQKRNLAIAFHLEFGKRYGVVLFPALCITLFHQFRISLSFVREALPEFRSRPET